MATSAPLQISVIIPTYGRPDLVVQCIGSILNGHYESFEILVIDQDTSRRLERKLFEQFPAEDRLRYFVLGQAGASRARNLGLQQARGKIVAFIDDDAVADAAWLSAMADVFLALERPPALVAGRIKPLWLVPKPTWYPAQREYLLGLYDIGGGVRPMPEQDQPISANMAGARAVITALGGFDERLGPNYFRKRPMLTGEDALLSQRARRAGHNLYYQGDAIVYHQIPKAKLSKRYFLHRHFWEGVTQITEMHLLGDPQPSRVRHLRYHLDRIVRSAVSPFLLRFRSVSDEARSVATMYSWSDAAFSLGVIYGLCCLEA